jgi:flagellar biosynthetic protein FliR
MINVSVLDPTTLYAFWFSFCRFSALLIFLPGLASGPVPNPVKVLFCIVVTYGFFPEVAPIVKRDIFFMGHDNFWILTIYYLLSGLMMGFLLKSILDIFLSCGSLMTQQMGFSSATYFDPTFGTDMGPLGKIIQWTIIMMVLSSGALIPIFKGAVQSFETLSIENFFISDKIFFYLNSFFKDLIKTSLLLSAPILFVTLMMNGVLGLIARFIPQMNVFVISFVANISLGLFVFYVIGNEFFYYGFKAYVKQLGFWFQLFS